MLNTAASPLQMKMINTESMYQDIPEQRVKEECFMYYWRLDDSEPMFSTTYSDFVYVCVLKLLCGLGK